MDVRFGAFGRNHMEYPMSLETRSNFVSSTRACRRRVGHSVRAHRRAAVPRVGRFRRGGGHDLFFLFSRLSSGMPERSFALMGLALAVCHRCSGIYLGLLPGLADDTIRGYTVRPRRAAAGSWRRPSLLRSMRCSPIAGLVEQHGHQPVRNGPSVRHSRRGPAGARHRGAPQ